jgi:hypothetical protein
MNPGPVGRLFPGVLRGEWGFKILNPYMISKIGGVLNLQFYRQAQAVPQGNLGGHETLVSL